MAHDTTEAVRLLADGAEKLAPDIHGREQAAETLITEFRACVTDAGLPFFVKRDIMTDVTIFGLLQRSIWITVDSKSGQVILRYKDQTKDVPLRYDRSLKMLTGEDLDTLSTPIPGQLRAYRSALAVLAEHAVAFLGQQS